MSDYPAQSMTPVSNVYALPSCHVALYTTGASNTLGTLVWTAQQVDNLRVAERYDELEITPTGAPYPETHHLAERHELIFDALWNVTAGLVRNTEYILVVTWANADLSGTSASWVRRFYLGVTTAAREVASREGNEFGSSHTLKAQYYVQTVHATTPQTLASGLATC